MAKKSSSAQGSASPKLAGGGPGDLRRVPALVEAWLKGDASAASALQDLGRDAAHPVLALAEKKRSAELAELGRRLLVTPPQVETNLVALRMASVDSRLAKARTAAPLLGKQRDVAVEGGAVAVFDPARVKESLARNGRPRRDPARVAAGDVAWVGLPSLGASSVRLVAGAPPLGQATLALRLTVESGVIFVGPPEASDGPRLGELRRDPFSTGLDEHLPRGKLFRLRAGTYRLDAFLADARLFLHLSEGGGEAPLAIDLDLLGAPPRAGEGSAGGAGPGE
jgi:hypothetical protein